MVAASFKHVRVWVFDLDDTLYPPDIGVMPRLAARMTKVTAQALGIAPDAAAALCLAHWRDHGSTLSGLIADHGIDPADWLARVHDVSLDGVSPDPALADAIAALPGRRIVFTNGPRDWADRILRARGLAASFHAIYGTEHARYLPKPQQAAYEAVFALDRLAPDRAAMFEDSAANLVVPHALGMRTVLVGPAPQAGAHLHHRTADLAGFLSQLGPSHWPRGRPGPI